MSQAHIQAADLSGVWRTYNITINDPIQIQLAMRSLKDQFPNYRVRAIDENGRLIDYLG